MIKIVVTYTKRPICEKLAFWVDVIHYLCSDGDAILFCYAIDYLSCFTYTENIDLEHLQFVEQ